MYEYGAIWTQNKQFVRNGFRFVFTYVTYQIDTSIFGEAADGLAFVIQNLGNDVLGDAGETFIVLYPNFRYYSVQNTYQFPSRRVPWIQFCKFSGTGI